MSTEAIERVVEQTRLRFADFAAKRSQSEPRLLRDVVAAQRGLARALTPLSLLPLGHSRQGGRRLVFLSGRFRSLLESVKGDDALLVGKVQDFRTARAIGVPFSFSGDLLAACYPIVDDRAGTASRRVIERWLKFFERQQTPCFLVVAHDTLPMSTLLVSIANECRNVVTVCIQHGLFDPSFHLDDIDGRNCRVNLVYDRAQRAEIERRLPGVVAEEMGLPTAFRSTGCRAAPLVVLVGTGVPEYMPRYERALAVFADAAVALRRAGMAVEYRPHPSESPQALQESCLALNTMGKEVLLGSERRLFVGFSSTLLYEAGCAGHGVILLEDAAVPGTVQVRGAVSLPTSAMDRIGSVAIELVGAPAASTESPKPIRERFYSALDLALARLDSSLR